MKRVFLLIILPVLMLQVSAALRPDTTSLFIDDPILVEDSADDEDVFSIFSSSGDDDFSGESSFTSGGGNSPLSWHGYVRGSLFGGGKAFDLANAFGEIALQPQFSRPNVILKSDLRFRGGMFFNESQTIVDVKELYAGYSSEKLDVTFGNQIVAWGRTDGFNPTNNITPNDLFFLSGEPDDQRMSNLLMRMKYRLVPSVELDLIAVPYYKPSNYRFDLFDLSPNIDIEGLPAGLMPDFDVGVIFNEMELPERKLENGSVGARLNFELPAISFALSFFSGYDPFHGFDMEDFKLNLLDPASPVQINYRPKSYLKNSFGFDFAMPAGSWIVKGEAAYNMTRNKTDRMYVPKPDFSYVFGLERMWGDFIFIGQYIGKAVTDYESLEKPVLENLLQITSFAHEMAEYESRMFNRKIFNQQEKLNHALALTVQGTFAYETVQAEMTTYYNLTSRELLWRPKLLYKINDALSVSAGANYMYGEEGSLFGYSKQVLSGAFMELKVMF